MRDRELRYCCWLVGQLSAQATVTPEEFGYLQESAERRLLLNAILNEDQASLPETWQPILEEALKNPDAPRPQFPGTQGKVLEEGVEEWPRDLVQVNFQEEVQLPPMLFANAETGGRKPLIRQGDYILLAGDSETGKTTLLMTILVNGILGYPTAYMQPVAPVRALCCFFEDSVPSYQLRARRMVAKLGEEQGISTTDIREYQRTLRENLYFAHEDLLTQLSGIIVTGKSGPQLNMDLANKIVGYIDKYQINVIAFDPLLIFLQDINSATFCNIWFKFLGMLRIAGCTPFQIHHIRKRAKMEDQTQEMTNDDIYGSAMLRHFSRVIFKMHRAGDNLSKFMISKGNNIFPKPNAVYFTRNEDTMFITNSPAGQDVPTTATRPSAAADAAVSAF